MRKTFLLFLCFVVLSAVLIYAPTNVQAALLNEDQISAILFLLQSFGVKESIVKRVDAILHGKTVSSEETVEPAAQSQTEPKDENSASEPPVISGELTETTEEAVANICETADSCADSASCNASGFYWYGNICNSQKLSPSGTGCLTAVSCTDYSSCTNAGFYWYTNKCNTSPQIIPCASATYCVNEASCADANYYWYDGSCHSAEKTNSGASVFGLHALFPRFFSR